MLAKKALKRSESPKSPYLLKKIGNLDLFAPFLVFLEEIQNISHGSQYCDTAKAGYILILRGQKA